MHEGEEKLPKEQWYNLARFLYFDKEDFDSALDVLNTLIIYPQEAVLGSGFASLRREKEEQSSWR